MPNLDRSQNTFKKGGGVYSLCADSSQMLWLPKIWQQGAHPQLLFELEACGCAGGAEVVTGVRAWCLEACLHLPALPQTSASPTSPS